MTTLAQHECGCNSPEIEREAKRKPVSAERRTPQVTIEAIMVAVGERGLAALQEPANIERLSRCDEAARKQINDRIAKLKIK